MGPLAGMDILENAEVFSPIPVAARSKAWVCARSLAAVVGSNPTSGIDVYCECCVLSGRGLYVGLNTSPDESYRLCVCVCVCVCESLNVIRCYGYILLLQ